MKDNGKYEEICCDFVSTRNEFLRSGDYLAEPPIRRWGKRKKKHKLGVLSLLPKHRVLVAMGNSDITVWEEVKFHPIISF